MPLLKPKKDEPMAHFVQRFMNDEGMKEEFDTQERRLAAAHEVWRRDRRKRKKRS